VIWRDGWWYDINVDLFRCADGQLRLAVVQQTKKGTWIVVPGAVFTGR